MIKRFITILKKEFKGYNLRSLSKDLLSAVTVAAVALPLSLAFGVSSAATAAAGLITAIIGGIIIGGLSGSSFQISGPTGAMSAILVGIAGQHGLDGVFIACLLSGIILIICALLKLGNLVSFIPTPVITGFTSGIAILIAFGQVGNFLGIKTQGHGLIENVKNYVVEISSINLTAFFIGLFVIILMCFYPKNLSSKFPSSLLALILVTAANFIFNFNVSVVGEIPKSIFLDDRLKLSDINFAEMKSLIVPAISIAMLGLIESLLCGVSASKMKGEPIDSQQELIAQGVGNVILPFFGGVPATAAIARTSVAIKSGGVTRLTSVFHAVFLLLSMFLLAPIMYNIPLSALAGVLMITAFRMNDWQNIKSLFNQKIKTAIFQFLITMIATIVFDLTIAILIGVAFSIVMFILMISKMQIDISDVNYDKFECEDNTVLKDIKVVYLTGPLYFGTANNLEQKLSELEDISSLIISMRGVPFADLTGVQVLEDLCENMKSKKVNVYFTSLQLRVMEMFRRCKIVSLLGDDNFFWSVDKALDKISKI